MIFKKQTIFDRRKVKFSEEVTEEEGMYKYYLVAILSADIGTKEGSKLRGTLGKLRMERAITEKERKKKQKNSECAHVKFHE